MAYGLGVDIGTSTTCAAAGDRSGAGMVPLGADISVPTVVSAGTHGGLVTGEAVSPATEAARDFKRRLGDPTPVVLGGVPYAPAALMAAVTRDVVAAVTARQGQAPAEVVLTCPAIWGPYRREQFAEVPALAGLTAARVITEAEAVATWYGGPTPEPGRVVVVYDLGAGTFDTSVLRADAEGWELLGTAEGVERLGGLEFDNAVLDEIDAALDGAVGRLAVEDPAERAALARIRANCTWALEKLSAQEYVSVPVFLPDGMQRVDLTRVDLERRIGPALDRTVEAVHRALRSASLSPPDVAEILLAGGSSRIPLVGRRIETEFGRPVRTYPHPENTAALGAAVLAGTGLAGPAAPASVAAERPRPSGRGWAAHPERLVRVLVTLATLLAALLLGLSLWSLQRAAGAVGAPPPVPARPAAAFLATGADPPAAAPASPRGTRSAPLGAGDGERSDQLRAAA